MLVHIKQLCASIPSPSNYSVGNKCSLKTGLYSPPPIPRLDKFWRKLWAAEAEAGFRPLPIVPFSTGSSFLCLFSRETFPPPVLGPLRRAGAIGHYYLNCRRIFRPWDSCLSTLGWPSPKKKASQEVEEVIKPFCIHPVFNWFHSRGRKIWIFPL